MIRIKTKKLTDNAFMPDTGSIDSAGFDVYAVEDTELRPHVITAVKIGLAFEPEFLLPNFDRFISNGFMDDDKVELTRIQAMFLTFIEDNIKIFTKVESRSGLCKKEGLHAEAGIIDSDYRGEVQILIKNSNKKSYSVKAGDKIAQLIVNLIPKVDFVEDKKLSETDRGEGGFGSTGK